MERAHLALLRGNLAEAQRLLSICLAEAPGDTAAQHLMAQVEEKQRAAQEVTSDQFYPTEGVLPAVRDSVLDEVIRTRRVSLPLPQTRTNAAAWSIGAVLLGLMMVWQKVRPAIVQHQVTAQYYDPGVAAYGRGDYATADADFNALLTMDSSDPAARYHLGLCRLAEGNRTKAEYDFRYVIATGAGMTLWSRWGPNWSGASQKMLDWMKAHPDWQPSSSSKLPF